MNGTTLVLVSPEDVDQDFLTTFKKNLDPFMVTHSDGPILDWDIFRSWRTFLENLKDHSTVECSITVESLEQQTYFGSEASLVMDEENREEEDGCHSHLSTSLPLGQKSGGVDIMDNFTYRKRCLSRLRLSLLQHCNLSPQDDSNDAVSEFDPALTQSGYNANRTEITSENGNNLLCWKDVVAIMDRRGFLPTDSLRGQSVEKVDASITHPTPHSVYSLENTSGHLCFKVNIGLDGTTASYLKTTFLTFCTPSFTSVENPLLLQNNSYCTWAVLSEPKSGTRCHTNIMGSHSWHILVQGRKKWRIAHPMDKYLLSHESGGRTANLWSPDPQVFPLAKFARIYEVIQNPGESLFIPSDAVYSDIAEEASFGFQLNFVDESCYPMFEYQTNYNLMLLSSLKFDYGYLQQFTIVDVVIRAPLHEKLPELIIRGTVWCSDTSALWTELGVRMELAALHECFKSIGEYLLCVPKEPHYAVGLPRGIFMCESERRVVIQYETPSDTYKVLEEALLYLTTDEEIDFRFFRAPNGGFPIHHPFSSTISQEGSLFSYIPLSVLFNQPWPFEEKLIRTCIALPQVILEKAKHPQGFVRPGSVWHYSNKNSPPCNYTKERTGLSFMRTSEDSLVDDISLSLASSTLSERNSALFYCSPLLRIPITLHPRNDYSRNESKQIGKKTPRIHEYAWDVEMLEKYGRVELLQFREPLPVVMKNEVCCDPQFENLKTFLVQHGLTLIKKEDALNSESLIAAILWILCTPCITGFTCPAGVQFDSGEFISSRDMYQFQMIGLPSRAAFALLKHVHHSSYGFLTTRLCNWICDIDPPKNDLLILKLFLNIKTHCDVEVGEILDQIRRVKDSLLQCSSGSLVNPQKLEFLSQFIRSFSDDLTNA